jgi:tight adherence protein B
MSVSLAALLVFLAVVFLFAAMAFAVGDALAARRRRRLASDPSAARVRLRRLARGDDRAPRGPIGRFDRWFSRLVRDTGLPWDLISATLLLILCGLGLGGALFLLREHVLLALLGSVVGTLAPLGYLLWHRRRRIRRLQDQLAPALDMLARSVRAGESLDQALHVVGESSPEPLAAEFRWCSRQLQMGLSIPAVMRSLVERVRLYDVRIFTATLTVHRQSGGNVARVLERLAGVIRDRLAYRRQLRVATGSGRVSAILVGSIGPLVFGFFFFFRQEYLNTMLESPIGQSLLVTAVALEVIGLIWTARLLKPAY